MERRPRLLFISPQFLFPADAGGKIRSTGILRGMKGGLFDITLASAAQGDEAQRFAAPLAEICDRYVAWPATRAGRLRRVAAMLSSEPMSAALDRSRVGQEAIARLLTEDFDVVVADFVHAAVLLDRPPRASVMFTHNVEAEIFARHALHARHGLTLAIWRSQCRKMTAFEGRHLPAFGKVIAVSERDLAFFVENYGVRGGETIPTSVDLEYFGAGEPVRSDVPALGGEIVFTGSMDWPANIDAMQYFRAAIWPLIAATRPAARLTVVGRNPPARLIEASHGLNWRFTGLVDDIRPFVRSADAYVVPLRVGGGTRIKIYEAMAMRRPVVSTAIGVEGLPLEPGRHYRLAETPEAFAQEILGLLADPGQGGAMAEEAYAFILKRFSTRGVARIFEEICCRAMGNRSRQPAPNAAALALAG